MGQYIPVDVSILNVMKDSAKKTNLIKILNEYNTNREDQTFNYLVTEFTLICVRSGKVKITTENEQVIYCESPGMLVLEKDQVVNASVFEVDGHLSFEVLEIPHDILVRAYELLINGLEVKPNKISRNLRAVYTKDFPARREVFDSLKKTLTQESIKATCNISYIDKNIDLVPQSIVFLLSSFIRHPVAMGMLYRSIKTRVRDTVYSILNAEPEKQWKLTDVSSIVFMSTSTLKRKLASEGTTFSEVYLTVRMNRAMRLLHSRKHSVSTVSVLCGYESVSYFIFCFKKRFNITPAALMNSVNN